MLRLEQHLGVGLAERNTRRFRLTTEGRRLVAEAGTFVAQLQTAAEVVQAEAGEVRGRLRLASPPGFGGPFVGSALARFYRQHPRVEIDLLVTDRQPHLVDEQIDVLFSTETTPDLPWTRRTLGRSWVIAVASPAYLEGRPALERPEELSKHVVLSGQRCPEGLVRWPRLSGPPMSVRPSLNTNDLPTLRVAALEGVGIALLPAHLVFDDLRSGALAQVLTSQVGAPLDIFALHVPERRKSPVLRAFFASVTAYVAELSPVMPGAPYPPRKA